MITASKISAGLSGAIALFGFVDVAVSDLAHDAPVLGWPAIVAGLLGMAGSLFAYFVGGE